MYTGSIVEMTRILALTPLERWEAARNLDDGTPGFMLDWRFVAAGVIAVAMLLIIWYMYRRHLRDRDFEEKKKEFHEVSIRHGLDHEQRTILALIARYAQLKDLNMIFNSADSYDLGAAKLMKQKFAQKRSVEERRYFNTQITQIKQQLGLKDFADSDETRLRAQTSRKIPLGKYLLVTKVNSDDACPMTAEVIDNTTYEFKLKTDEVLESGPGQEWRVHYQLGAMVWSFETVELNSQGRELTLSHSDQINFINRRKFAHASVSLPGFVAFFSSIEEIGGELKAPQFVKAEVTELSGPGLLVKTSLGGKVGQRVLMVFKLTDDQLMQSTAIIRRVETGSGENVMAVEMTGLSEACINELISVTNHVIAQKVKSEKEELEGEQELIQSGSKIDG